MNSRVRAPHPKTPPYIPQSVEPTLPIILWGAAAAVRSGRPQQSDDNTLNKVSYNETALTFLFRRRFLRVMPTSVEQRDGC